MSARRRAFLAVTVAVAVAISLDRLGEQVEEAALPSPPVLLDRLAGLRGAGQNGQELLPRAHAVKPAGLDQRLRRTTG